MSTMTSMRQALSVRSSSDLAGSPSRDRAPECAHHPGARINLLLKSSYLAWVEVISRLLAPHALTHSDYVTLLAMHRRPGWVANPSLLAAVTAETRANTTRICDRLTRQGLIRRVGSARDRRKVDLTLTESGTGLVEVLEPQVDRLLDSAFSIFSSEERLQLESMLQRLIQGPIGGGRGHARLHPSG